jgi:molybdate transport system ATP-binding protein
MVLSVDIVKNLPDFQLKIQFSMEQDILVLFGPSGCGKTTTLRCIAGLLKPDAGRIVYEGQPFHDSVQEVFVPPRERNIGYMFQDYALFPHMNVQKNIWYGVRNQTGETSLMYEKLISLLKIGHLAKRYTTQLSGGEKQRVALARALMAQPRILLLDEPLSSLDLDTRLELQQELKNMQKLWKIPFILVTHDPEEALSMGTEVFFIDQGRQVERPDFLAARHTLPQALHGQHIAQQ